MDSFTEKMDAKEEADIREAIEGRDLCRIIDHLAGATEATEAVLRKLRDRKTRAERRLADAMARKGVKRLIYNSTIFQVHDTGDIDEPRLTVTKAADAWDFKLADDEPESDETVTVGPDIYAGEPFPEASLSL